MLYKHEHRGSDFNQNGPQQNRPTQNIDIYSLFCLLKNCIYFQSSVTANGEYKVAKGQLQAK